MLAFDSITRQNYFLAAYRPILTPEQIGPTIELIESFDGRYTELRNARARILEEASDHLDVATMLINNRVEVLELSRLVRRTIFRDILTREQRLQHKQMVEENRARRRKLKEQNATGNPG